MTERRADGSGQARLDIFQDLPEQMTAIGE
jgi:hypothetical protein